MNPRMDPFWACQNSARATALMPGVRDLGADPVDRQQEEGEDDPLPELRDAEDVSDTVEH